MEHGWLAFVSGDVKRRLAPYPPEWAMAAIPELERLCGLARETPATRYPFDAIDRRERHDEQEAARRTEAPATTPGAPERVGDASVEDVVRRFAHDSRARGIAAVEAMVQLKLRLATQFPEPTSPARDMRAVRRWFVESYYFERGT